MVCRRHRQAVLDVATSRKELPLQMLKLNDTLVEADMSGTPPGNQARSGYGGNNERLRFAVSPSASLVYLQTAAQLPRGEVLTNLSSPELGSEFGQSSDSSLGSAGDSELFENSDSKFREKKVP